MPRLCTYYIVSLWLWDSQVQNCIQNQKDLIGWTKRFVKADLQIDSLKVTSLAGEMKTSVDQYWSKVCGMVFDILNIKK